MCARYKKFNKYVCKKNTNHKKSSAGVDIYARYYENTKYVCKKRWLITKSKMQDICSNRSQPTRIPLIAK